MATHDADPAIDAKALREDLSATARARWKRSTWRSTPARRWSCSGLPDAARPRRCASSPGSSRPTPAGRCCSTATDVTAVPIEQRNVGMVFQSYALFPNMSVAENIGYGLRTRLAAARAGRASRDAGDDAHRGARTIVASTSSRADSASASRWRARSLCARAYCCSTSRSPRSTPSCATTCASRSTAAALAQHHHRVRHPRPGRSDGAWRPDRRDGRMGGSRRSVRRVRSTSARRLGSSPSSSAR